MRRRLLGLVSWLFAAYGYAFEAIPIHMPPPTAEGVSVKELHGDKKFLYLKSSNHEFVSVDKKLLLSGTIQIRKLSLQQWDEVAQRMPSSTLVPQNSNGQNDQRQKVWRTSTHEIETEGAYCAEGLEDWHSLVIDHRMVSTGLARCLSLVNPIVFGGKLWFGTSEPGEYADGPGVGILVFDLISKQRVARLRRQLVNGESGLMFADADVKGVWVVNKNALHLFDHDFNLKGRWYYSEQFDHDGVDWSVFHMSPLPEIHNPFAVFARLAMMSGIERGQSDEDYETLLQKRRWISTSGINF